VLDRMGYQVTIIERNDLLGGHINDWAYLFPTFRSSWEIMTYYHRMTENSSIKILLDTEVLSVRKENELFNITTSDKKVLTAHAVLVATGFDLFDATKKEEYGYGIYQNVITQSDLEKMFKQSLIITTPTGKTPKKIGFVHCVGSRDEKAGNLYCSKICCVTAVKQAIEIKKHNPEIELFCFYMDMRMGGPMYEELYREAQEKWGVYFIRGRVSEAAETIDSSIQVKVEDTLAGRPLKMTVDILVLMAGMVPSKGNKELSNMLEIEKGENGFYASRDMHLLNNISKAPGVFIAGTALSPMIITETIADAKAAAVEVARYLEGERVWEEYISN
jgi:heterodisulfide reductase subunit A2